jgi:hypothetical protein
LQDQSRQKTLSEIHDAETRRLQTYDWQNREKGFIRIPIERAMDLTAIEWQNPAVGRSNLMARAAISLATPPPPPSATNQYE